MSARDRGLHRPNFEPHQIILTPSPAGPPARQNILTPPPTNSCPGPGGAAAPANRSVPAPDGSVAPADTAYVFLCVETFLCLFLIFFTGLFTLMFKGTIHFFFAGKLSSRALSRIFPRKENGLWLNYWIFLKSYQGFKPLLPKFFNSNIFRRMLQSQQY